MTDPTQEQRARWLEKFRDVSFATSQSKDPEAIVVTDDDTIVALCATIAAEAVLAHWQAFERGESDFKSAIKEVASPYPEGPLTEAWLKGYQTKEAVFFADRPGAEEAVAAERQRLGLDGEAEGLTDEEIDEIWGNAVRETMPKGKSAHRVFARALLASQRDRETLAERERCARWQPIETVPTNTEVLMYCPHRGIANEERIELGWAKGDSGWEHSWATHWMPLPDGPSAAAYRAGEE